MNDIRSYYGVVLAPSDGLLLGGVRRHISSRFRTAEAAEAWTGAVISGNVGAGRTIESFRVAPSQLEPQIDE